MHCCTSNLAHQIALANIDLAGIPLINSGHDHVPVRPVPVLPADPWGIPGTSCSEVGHWMYCVCGESCRDDSREYGHFIDDHQDCAAAGVYPDVAPPPGFRPFPTS